MSVRADRIGSESTNGLPVLVELLGRHARLSLDEADDSNSHTEVDLLVSRESRTAGASSVDLDRTLIPLAASPPGMSHNQVIPYHRESRSFGHPT